MAKKIEHIEQQLTAAIERGDFKVIVAAGEPVWNHTNSFDIIRVSPTPTSSYSFPNTSEMLSLIEKRRKALERKIANRINYGDERGRSAVFSDNQTAKQLALLNGRPDYLRVAYRAWCMSQKAPKAIQQYVYHNLIVHANRYHQDAERFYLREIDRYTFEVLPPAWRKCMDDPCPELEGVTLLGNNKTQYKTTYSPEVLEKFPNKHPGNDYMVTFNCPEFTSLCPKTGQPDFAEIKINYIPDQYLVESKSLKLYMFSFRNHGDFHEDCVNIIMKDLVKLLDPKYIEVEGIFMPRGGISLYPFANYGKPGTEFETIAKNRLFSAIDRRR